MKKIGLTGNIGSGKTTAAKYFKNLGVPVFIADDCAKELMNNDFHLKKLIIELLGTSAWYAPGAAVSSLVQAIACDQHKMFPCSALLEGEYGMSDLCIGVPVILGKNGIEKIVEIDLSDVEKEKLAESAQGVKATNSLLSEVNA